MNRVAFLTTVYPMNLVHLNEMLESLVNQSYKNFDLVVVNDNLQEFSHLKQHYSNHLTIIELAPGKSPIENRKIGLEYCRKCQYDFLIFGDSDDKFSVNRVKDAISLLSTYDVIVNDLTLFTNEAVLERNYLSNRLSNNQLITFDDVKNKNFLGLSNTSIKLSLIEDFTITNDLIAFDWFFFSVLLLQGKKAFFSNSITTYYRQHADNLVGMKELTLQGHIHGWHVKKLHYAALSKVTDLVNDEYAIYSKEAPVFIPDQPKKAFPLWWELI